VTFANSDQKTCTGCGTTCACRGNNKTSRSRGSFKSILIALLVLVGLQFGYGTVLLLTKEAAKKKVENIPYTTHVNTRFGYSLCYDPSLFTQQPSTPKSDVEIFTSKDGHASFAVYGSVLGSWGLPQIFDMQVKSFTDQDPSAIVNGRALQPMSYDNGFASSTTRTAPAPTAQPLAACWNAFTTHLQSRKGIAGRYESTAFQGRDSTRLASIVA
jgi:hypothetical protein